MGSFGISCGVSKLPIDEGKKAGILIISKQKYSVLDGIDSSCNLVSNSGSYGAFYAIGLPIFGKYNDYGRISYYEEDENYHIMKKFIEKHSYSFDEFMDNLYQGDAPLLNGIQVAGMFIHGEVYDEVIKRNKGCLKSLDMTSHVMDILGFHKTDEPTGDKRYKYMYRFKDTDIEIHHDGKWGHFIKDGKQHSMYNPLDLKKGAKKLFGVDIDVSMFEKISKYDIKFDELREKLLEIENIPDDDPIKQYRLSMDSRDLYRHSGFSLGTDFGFDGLKEIYKDSIIDGTIKKRLVDWVKFYWFMFSTNTLIMPTMLGEQHGNHNASRLLYEIAGKISQETLDYYGDDCYEDEY